MKRIFFGSIFFILVLSFLIGASGSSMDISGNAATIDSLSDCLNVSYCVNYQTKSDCEENLCSVFDEAVERSINCGEGYICGCWWNESVNRCGPYWEFLWNDSNCFPNCSGKECGDDGCGGICGSCINKICNSVGICVDKEPYEVFDFNDGTIREDTNLTREGSILTDYSGLIKSSLRGDDLYKTILYTIYILIGLIILILIFEGIKKIVSKLRQKIYFRDKLNQKESVS